MFKYSEEHRWEPGLTGTRLSGRCLWTTFELMLFGVSFERAIGRESQTSLCWPTVIVELTQLAFNLLVKDN